MPQMAPINWLSLFFMFTMTFIMFNILNYFSFSFNNNLQNKNKNFIINMKKINWKW